MQETVEGYGDWAHGGDPATTAAEWVAAGFSPEEADAWLDFGVWDPAAAVAGVAAGVDPTGATTLIRHLGMTLGALVSNGDARWEDKGKLVARDEEDDAERARSMEVSK